MVSEMNGIDAVEYGHGTLPKTVLTSAKVLALLFATLLALAWGSPAWAETLTVTSNADAGDGSLRAAVDVANSNGEADTITFDLPEGDRTITLAGQISFTASQETTIDGGQVVTVSGGDATRVFSVRPGAEFAIERLTVSDGNASGSTGGGIYNEGTLSVTGSTISGNSANAAGGIDSLGTLSVTGSTVSGNSASNGGGGLFNYHGVLSVTDSTISGNSASFGGGIHSNTDLTSSTTTIENSTISGNTATNRGGGFRNFTGLATIRNTTITNNTAPDGSGAGVVSTADTATRTVVGASIIAANSTTDVDYIGSTNPFSSEGYNVLGDGNAANFNETGDQTGVADPGLGLLADNGGPTKTHALLEGSPAVDKGNTSLATDQRGLPRPRDDLGVPDAVGGDSSDVGAVEVRPTPPEASITGTQLSEGTGGTADAVFSVRLSKPALEPASVRYATADDTATSPSDYEEKTGTLTFEPRQTTAEIRVPVVGDDRDEPGETFFVNLSEQTNATINNANAGARATITDDDAAPTVSVGDVTVAEGDSGTTSARFAVTLSAPSGRSVSVDYATADGTATAPSDYATTDGTLFFGPGAEERALTVPVSGDTADEPDEGFLLRLTDPENAAVTDGEAAGTITDDDEPNAAPVAVDDSYATGEGRALHVAAPGLLGNDTDPDPGDTLTAAEVTDAAHGEVFVKPDGSLAYLPDTGFVGEDSFTYKASDGVARSGGAAVKITVVPAEEPPAPNSAPAITDLSPAPGFKTRDLTPTIRATVLDTGTDLQRDNIRLYVDGRRMTSFSYDRATDRLSRTTGRLGPGRHTVLVVARDGGGLSSSRMWGFRVVR